MAKKRKKTKLRKEVGKKLRQTHKKGSNKLIYAVAGGLGLIFIIALLVVFSGDRQPLDKGKVILETTEYLKKNTAITNIQPFPEENKVLIEYDVDLKDENSKVDFKQIARFAGIRLSHELDNETVTVELREVNKKEDGYQVTIKNREVLAEKIF